MPRFCKTCEFFHIFKTKSELVFFGKNLEKKKFRFCLTSLFVRISVSLLLRLLLFLSIRVVSIWEFVSTSVVIQFVQEWNCCGTVRASWMWRCRRRSSADSAASAATSTAVGATTSPCDPANWPKLSNSLAFPGKLAVPNPVAAPVPVCLLLTNG